MKWGSRLKISERSLLKTNVLGDFQHASLTNSTLWDKPSHSTPQSEHAPVCAYTEIQFTNSRARLAEVLHWKHNTIPTRSRERKFNQRQFVCEKTPHNVPSQHPKHWSQRIITRENDPANLRLSCTKRSTSENTSRNCFAVCWSLNVSVFFNI